MSRIAIDFDGTLFKWSKFPEIGEPVPYALEVVKRLKACGHELILWTCRDGDRLQMAKDKLLEYGLEFHHYNVVADQYLLSNKVDADLFIDDKAAFCPLITCNTTGRKYVDWLAMEIFLRRAGMYTIIL